MGKEEWGEESNLDGAEIVSFCIIVCHEKRGIIEGVQQSGVEGRKS